MFKAPKSIAQAQSPQMSVIDRNQEFTKTKNKKLQEQEFNKYKDLSFKPTLVSRQKTNSSINTTVSDVGDRLYSKAMSKEDRMAKKRQEIEQEQQMLQLMKEQRNLSPTSLKLKMMYLSQNK